MRFLGVAAALHGFEPLRLTTSVVGGEDKDSITLVETRSASVNPHSPDSVRTVFIDLFQKISAILSQQEVPKGKQVPVPIVFGASTAFNGTALIRSLSVGFPEFVTGSREFFSGLDTLDRGSSSVRTQAHNIFFQDLLRSAICRKGPVAADRFNIEARDFVDPLFELGLDRTAAIEHCKAGVPEFLEMALKNLKKIPKEQAEPHLHALIEVYVDRFFEALRGRIDLKIDNSRFVMVCPPYPELREFEYYNFFREDMALRRVFAEAIIRKFGVTHNICVKCPRDLPSPPFSDVVATLLADNMDRVTTGFVSPTAVMIRGGVRPSAA